MSYLYTSTIISLLHYDLQAYHYGMTFPHYLFISYYQYSQFWWINHIQDFSATYPNLECNEQMLTDAIYRSLAVDYFPMPTAAEENATTDVGYVSRQMHINFTGTNAQLLYFSCS